MTSAGQSIEASWERLEQELAVLTRQWDSTRLVWRDEVCDRFEKDFWTAIHDETERYLRAAREVAEAMRAVDLRRR